MENSDNRRTANGGIVILLDLERSPVSSSIKLSLMRTLNTSLQMQLDVDHRRGEPLAYSKTHALTL